jgi:hypothetical protein
MDVFNQVLQTEIELQEHFDHRPDIALGLAQIKLENNQQFHRRQQEECQNEPATTSM